MDINGQLTFGGSQKLYTDFFTVPGSVPQPPGCSKFNCIVFIDDDNIYGVLLVFMLFMTKCGKAYRDEHALDVNTLNAPS